MIHFCWINLLSDIMSYRPILSKKDILETQNLNQVDQVVYDKSLLKIKLFPDDKSNF